MRPAVVVRSGARHMRRAIGREALLARRKPGVVGEVGTVGLVTAGETQGPGAAWRLGKRRDIEGRQGARRQRLVGQQVAGPHFLDGDESLPGRMSHGHELAARAEPHVAVLVGIGRVEERDIGPERRQQDDGIAAAIGKRIVDDVPVRPRAQKVGADEAAQRHEGHALLGRLERSVNRGAGGVADREPAAFDRCGEAGGVAELAEAHRRSLDGGDAARAHQEVRRDAGLRHRERGGGCARCGAPARVPPPSARTNSPAAAPASRRPRPGPPAGRGRGSRSCAARHPPLRTRLRRGP